MPSFTFKGFTTGNPVSLSATQGGTTVPASVLTWGENTVEEFEGSFTITATEAATIPAPTAVWFEASNLQGFDVEETSATAYDPSFDGVTFVWTVERTGAGANEAVHGTYGAVPKLVDGWNSTRVAYGKKVAFFFDEPDVTYQVRCWAIDQSGNRGVGTRATGEEGLEITTQNADDIYGGIATICLDPSGAFTGAPSGAQQVTSVLALEGGLHLEADLGPLGLHRPLHGRFALGRGLLQLFGLGGELDVLTCAAHGQRQQSEQRGSDCDFAQHGSALELRPKCPRGYRSWRAYG